MSFAKFSQNTREVLKLLLDDARMSDSNIGDHLKISSQAVGRIRRKLEGSVISKYSAELNHDAIGTQTQAFVFARLTDEGKLLGEHRVSEIIHQNPHIVSAYRVQNKGWTHVLLYSFQSSSLPSSLKIDDFDDELSSVLEFKELVPVSGLKNNSVPLLKKYVDGGVKGQRVSKKSKK